jgi:hypothetical protein
MDERMINQTDEQATELPESSAVLQALPDARDAKIAKLAAAWERALAELFDERAAA